MSKSIAVFQTSTNSDTEYDKDVPSFIAKDSALDFGSALPDKGDLKHHGGTADAEGMIGRDGLGEAGLTDAFGGELGGKNEIFDGFGGTGDQIFGAEDGPAGGSPGQSPSRGDVTAGLGMARTTSGDGDDEDRETLPPSSTTQDATPGQDDDPVQRAIDEANILTEEARKVLQAGGDATPSGSAPPTGPRPRINAGDDRPAPDDDGGSGPDPVDAGKIPPTPGHIDFGDEKPFVTVDVAPPSRWELANPSVDPVDDDDMGGAPFGGVVMTEEDIINPSVDPIDLF